MTLKKVFGGLQKPVYLTGAADGRGRYFVVQQEGSILVFDKKNQGTGEVFLDIEDRVENLGEKGLLSMAFHPRYKENGKLYVNYTTRQEGKLKTRISEFKTPPGKGVADPKSERILLSFNQPYSNHNGGLVLFGPDGYLYIGTGDGGYALDPKDNGQRLDTLLGKILRIDVTHPSPEKKYGIPEDNPFVGRSGARPEIYAYGLRNPWRFSFDKKTGWLYAGDVGQNDREEIDVIEKGKNYGWRIMEGDICTPGISSTCNPKEFTPPIWVYGRKEGISVTGGYVYRGKKYPSLDGIYFFADYGTGNIWGLKYNGKEVTWHQLMLPSSLNISSFGEDDTGELYVVDHGGSIYQITTP